mmetsp:Transcript_22357/g.26923  ORF Transcript_22357/g.26923 Transcript_22357/m.26923 type:complete len:245 (+) Transcript_22357:229-963(+)|eukprot:CAMPEP_0197848248 /NCGR_PEP_ID=MMETSP1438-20131217/8052_1 /TAXON_ID=1461541 /ORGANISM="Pterosperma sp., Strain CCMP1384" /LENGTH=244 /DNA_ID=CAMNT_0043460399 /DNA_START=241 /DNA_END=975 /DNA_ORIENTATION=-
MNEAPTVALQIKSRLGRHDHLWGLLLRQKDMLGLQLFNNGLLLKYEVVQHLPVSPAFSPSSGDEPVKSPSLYSFVNSLTGKREPLVVAPRLDVVEEEVAVDRGLHNARGPHNPLAVADLGEVSVDPVEQVQAAVCPEKEDIVSGQGVHILSPLEQDQLRENGNGFKVDGECPQHLSYGEVVVDEQGEHSARSDQENVSEGVVILVVSLAYDLVTAHVPDDCERCRDENNLHNRVVNRDEAEEKI